MVSKRYLNAQGIQKKPKGPRYPKGTRYSKGVCLHGVRRVTPLAKSERKVSVQTREASKTLAATLRAWRYRDKPWGLKEAGDDPKGLEEAGGDPEGLEEAGGDPKGLEEAGGNPEGFKDTGADPEGFKDAGGFRRS